MPNKQMTKENIKLIHDFVQAFMDANRDEMVERITQWKLSGRIMAKVSPDEVLEVIEDKEGFISLHTALYKVLPKLINPFLASHVALDIKVHIGDLIDEVDGMVQ